MQKTLARTAGTPPDTLPLAAIVLTAGSPKAPGAPWPEQSIPPASVLLEVPVVRPVRSTANGDSGMPLGWQSCDCRVSAFGVHAAPAFTAEASQWPVPSQSGHGSPALPVTVT